MDFTQPLRIENGQFMRGNNIEKPEIGNREQIECLQAYERAEKEALEKAETEGIRCECFATNITYTSNIRLKCLCGKDIDDEMPSCSANDGDELGWVEEDWDDEIIECRHCGREYKVQGGRAKLISK